MSSLDANTIKPRESHSGPAPIASVCLTIAHHLDPARVGELAPLFDLDSGRTRVLSRAEPVFRTPAGARSAALLIPELSRRPIELHGGAGAAVRLCLPEDGSALLVDGAPPAAEHALTDEQVRRGVVLELADSIVLLLHVMQLVPHQASLGLVGESAALHALRAEILRVADLDVPVLLRGETGAGKELVAQAIHALSARRDRPLVAVNMSALPEGTAAAELFGHAKGAFTGADAARQGYFEQADGGTLLLDEIGDLPAPLQPLLLRVLESGELQRVGGGARRVDVRVLSATDGDLESAVAQGRFREPLLQRLAAYELRIPPLRERREDIGLLFLHFLRAELAALGEADKLVAPAPGERGFVRSAFVARLLRHDWPGNVRELKNVARRVAVGGRGSARMQVDDTLDRLLRRSEKPVAAPAPGPDEPASASEAPAPRRTDRRPPDLDDAELQRVLREHGYNLNRAAVALAVSRTWLNARIERASGLRKAKDLSAEEIERERARHGGDLEAAAAALEVSPRGLLLQMKRLGMR